MCKQVLGKGAFGVVYEATCLEDKKQYACKSISKAKLVTKVGKAHLSMSGSAAAMRLPSLHHPFLHVGLHK